MGRKGKSLGLAYMCPSSDEPKLFVLHKGKQRRQITNLPHMGFCWYPNSPSKGKGSCGPPAFL